jgi:hypothetical protein
MIKIKIHSVVDVITNSSTVIYTYQDGSEKPVRELIEEIFKLSNITENIDDVFEFGLEGGFEDENDRDDDRLEPDTYLIIKTKDSKYEYLSNLIERVLNSITADGRYDG